MTRGVARYLVGSLVVLGLAACGKQWLAEREPWRHEAEVACLKSGLVKEGPALARIEPISGPGICGADFPLKVAAIGEGSVVGFADELRPPAGIPNARQPLADPQLYTPRPAASYPAPQYPQHYPATQQYPTPQQYPAQQYPPAQPYPQQAYPQQGYPQAAPGAPASLRPPGVPEPETDEGYEDEEAQGSPPGQEAYPPAYPQQRRQGYGAPRAVPGKAYSQPYPPAEPVPLGRQQAPVAIGAVTVQPAATLACPIVSALDRWFADAVQPAAIKWFGASVAEIRQISAYSCRGMNGQRGAHISEHAFGNALDIASFTLADGRKISVKDGWRGLPEEQGFLRDVQGAACQQFMTVLAPGSNAFHYDHIHVDLMRRASGRAICNPAAVAGEVVAARAGYRIGGRGEPGVTGSIPASAASEPPRKVSRRVPTFRAVPGRDEVYDGLPRAVAGQD
jgi:hypothetical protein